MKKLIIAAAAIAFATPAFANGTYGINLDANRTVECYVDGLPDDVLFGSLGRRGQAEAVTTTGIEVFCNQPSTVTFTSTEGYLKLATGNNANDSISESNFTSAANPGFSAGLDYSVTVPSFALYSGPFSADTSDVEAGFPETLANVPALNDPSVALRFDTIAENQPLLGGDYSDQLTITITAAGV